jgi:hypothetical protein
MALPRRIRPGSIVMITRRTLRRTHLLRPDSELTALYVYCLAVLAPRHGIAVHAAVLMSTHEHLIVTDSRGELPRFLQQLHRIVALAVKVLRGWEGAVWDHEKTSVVELRTPQAVVEKLAYVMANPVAAGLVASAKQWPGLTTAPEHLGRTQWTAARPDYYFDADNPGWPATATLPLVLPAIGMTEAELERAVRYELRALELAAQQAVKRKGWRFSTPARLRQLSPFDRAKSWEPLRGRNPTFAVGRGQRAAFFEAVLELRVFRAAYRVALESWRAGVRAVTFPAGTWLMRWLHAAQTVPT